MYSKSLCSTDPGFNALSVSLKTELCNKNVMGIPFLGQRLSSSVGYKHGWSKPRSILFPPTLDASSLAQHHCFYF